MDIPHASPIFQCIRAALQSAIKMAVDFVFALTALIHKRQLKQRPHVRTLAGQRDENGDVHRRILDILPIRVEVNRPIVTTDAKSVAGDVFTGAYTLGQRVAFNGEAVRAIDGLADRFRARVVGIKVAGLAIHNHLIWILI